MFCLSSHICHHTGCKMEATGRGVNSFDSISVQHGNNEMKSCYTVNLPCPLRVGPPEKYLSVVRITQVVGVLAAFVKQR